jgi:Holliday junction resolvase RusA-like endonuclease
VKTYSVVVVGQRPWTTNQERKKGSHYQRSAVTKWWREAFRDAALEAEIPHFESIRIEVTPILPDRRIQDTGACFPTAKAAIDGLVDAGVIDDDAPQYVPTITFHAPVICKQGGLEILIIPEVQK